MKNVFSTVMVLAAGIVIGIIANSWLSGPASVATSGTGTTERSILYWKAPMDPGYRSDKPGKSPMGMDLVPVYATDGDTDVGVVSISPQVVNNLGIRTAKAEYSVLSRRIETVGYVGYDEETLQHIHMRVDGWIESLAITATGDAVIKGQTLFELYSPTLVNAEEEYLTALNSSNLGLQEASHERLVALGVPLREIKRLKKSGVVRQRLKVLAQSDGYVANLAVREGVYITPSSEVMSIAKLDRVWVLGEVFERQAGWIQPGQLAEVELDYLPGQRLQGKVDYVYPELDLKTRTLKVRMRFENKAELLRPNMFARVTIYSTATDPVVNVPLAALIRGGAFDRVVLALGDGKFRAQPVQVGIESGNRVEIRSGIVEGDLVVTSGQFLIDSESNIDSALASMDTSVSEGMAMSDDTMVTEQLPLRVQVAAVVRGIDIAERKLKLEHQPVTKWSWPAMTMRFSVSDESLLEGLNEGQSVTVTIEKQVDDNYVVTGLAQAMHHGDDMEQDQ